MDPVGTPEKPAEPSTPAEPYSPIAAAPVVAAAVDTSPNPGKVLGIWSLVTSLLNIGIAGLILGILGLRKSSKAGHKNGLALAGIIISGIDILIITPIFIAIVVVSYNGITTLANDTSAAASACANQGSTGSVTIDKYSFLCGIDDNGNTTVSRSYGN